MLLSLFGGGEGAIHKDSVIATPIDARWEQQQQNARWPGMPIVGGFYFGVVDVIVPHERNHLSSSLTRSKYR